MFGKHAPAVATLVHNPLPTTARENKDLYSQLNLRRIKLLIASGNKSGLLEPAETTN